MKRAFNNAAVAVYAASALFFLAATTGAAQSPLAPRATLLVEDFTAAAGTLITTTGWTAHSAGGTNPIATSSPGLSMTGYPGSDIGNAVSLTTSGEDDNKTFPVQSTGSVYAAFLVTISQASTDAAGGYFFHLGPDPVSTTFRGRVFIKRDASNNVAFGISKSLTAAADIAYTPFVYSLNTTYLVIVKYTIVDGATNDTVALFVSTTVPATEPAATVTATDTSQTDISPGTVSLRQGSAATAPTVRVDGIRVGTDWASVTQPTVPVAAPVDFDGDGRTDFVVTRNTNNPLGGAIQKYWYTSLNGTAATSVIAWGLDGDQEVPVDFDGDGKDDVAVWRRSGTPDPARYYILQSLSNTVRIESFGLDFDDVGVTGDYDGDGKADPSTFRCPPTTPGQCTFYYRGSLNNPGGNITFVPWGFGTESTITANPGDFDGDGKYDFCIRRDIGGGAGQFVLLRSSDSGVEYINWGLTSDAIIPGDFDGDAKSDFCVVRFAGNQGHWYILERDGGGTGASPIIFGDPTQDFGAWGDYDGDGMQDIAVWRPNADATMCFFFVRQSSNGALMVREWGQLGDQPVAEWNGRGGPDN